MLISFEIGFISVHLDSMVFYSKKYCSAGLRHHQAGSTSHTQIRK